MFQREGFSVSMFFGFFKNSITCFRWRTLTISICPTAIPSAAFSSGRKHRFHPAFQSADTKDRTPRTGLTLPSSPSSPINTEFSKTFGSVIPYAVSTATATGRSKAVPSLRISAGDRLMVIFLGVREKPEFFRAVLTRSSASFTSEARYPTI